jgi:RNA polymerase sigma-54 factor
MALEQKLSLRLAQRLVMTPSLQQAIKLLQMTRLELEGVLSQELEENPLLETAEETEEPEEQSALDAGNTAEDASAEEATSLEEIDFDAFFDDLDVQDYSPSGSFEEREAVPIENTLTREPDLYDHLYWQLQMMELPPLCREIAELIIGNLDEDGFLKATIEELQILGLDSRWLAAGTGPVSSDNGSSPPGLRGGAFPTGGHTPDDAQPPEPGAAAQGAAAVGEGYPRGEVEAALAVVRQLDPPGIGCADLRESLLAQLESQAEEGSLAYRVILDHWPRLLRRQFPQIAKELEIPLAELEEPIEIIKSLETRPGRQYGGQRTLYVEPDVAVVKVGEDYVIQLNDDGLPRLRVSRAYRRMLREMRREGRETAAQQFIKDKMRSAVWLIKSLDQRQRTIFKVADSIIRQQRGFLDRGIDALRPMVLRDVAEDIGMHESTVSRVVSNKYIHTPRGLYPLKFFFHSGIDRDRGEDISSLTVKRKIQHMIDGENSKRPLSDSALMKRLNEEGINIARRTVAKYRDELGIPSSTDRRQIF